MCMYILCACTPRTRTVRTPRCMYSVSLHPACIHLCTCMHACRRICISVCIYVSVCPASCRLHLPGALHVMLCTFLFLYQTSGCRPALSPLLSFLLAATPTLLSLPLSLTACMHLLARRSGFDGELCYLHNQRHRHVRNDELCL